MTIVPATHMTAVIIGGGPAGLMAAEVLALAGVKVDLFDGMPSVGRKFLLAGVGGMNITHAETQQAFLDRYAERRSHLEPMLNAFGAAQLREWVHGLGIDTFVGSSGRVFPADMKAAPLLRAWLKRLREHGVTIHTRQRWLGWSTDGRLRIASAAGERLISADAVLLALGGGSWARLGSDGTWMPLLAEQGVQLQTLQPSNCGFDVAGWSQHFAEKFAGAPVKSCALGLAEQTPRLGEFVITSSGVEGSLVYALSAPICRQLDATGSATLWLDLLPGKSPQQLEQLLRKPRGSKSMSNHLRTRLGIEGVRAGLLRELTGAGCLADPQRLATAIKRLPLRLVKARPLEEAISSAGGVCFEALTAQLMLKQLPGVFCAGEMLDWEAPTGGYLLTACFASGRLAGQGMLDWLQPDKRSQQMHD